MSEADRITSASGWRAGWPYGRAFLEAAVVGGILGTIDVFSTETMPWMLLVYCGFGALLGCRHAGQAWVCWVPLGFSMYAVHVVAILLGQQPPYVEATTVAARQQTLFLWPTGFGLLNGVGLRVAVSLAGYGRRRSGPPVRLWPRTTRAMMGAVAWVAGCMALLNWQTGDALTQYAPGYSEARFRQVKVGQTYAEVTAALGPPLHKWDWSQTQDDKTWAYSYGVSDTCNYWRRWIFFHDGKVATTIADFWYD